MDYTHYLMTDRPIPYKGLEFFPVKVKDYPDFLWYVECLLIDKNSIPDIRVISMSYLQFLFYLADNDEPIHLSKLLYLICLVTHTDKNNFNVIMDNGKPLFIVNGVNYNANDLLEIKKIILLQNDVDDIDETIEKELRDKLKEAEELKAKLSGVKPGTIEDNILCLISALPGLTLDDIYEMPIRKFNRALKRADHLLHYKIYLSASMSGMVTFKDKSVLKHWMSNLDSDDKYKDVKMSVDELSNKVSMSDLQKSQDN